MSTGSKALDRKVDEWLANIKSGALRLPSFQRHVAWDRQRVTSMLNTLIRDLPLGITLILEVGDHELFHSRPLLTAPDTPGKVTEHLLDGQQRLTALWRALKDGYERETYFIHVPELDEDPENDDVEVEVRFVKRRRRRGARYPLWADSPAECLRQGLVPVRLLDPEYDTWMSWVDDSVKPLEPGSELTDVAELRAAIERQTARRDQVKDLVSRLREVVRHYNLPYLRLPASTPRHVALGVFVNMNTNAKPLTAYDIVVAEVESKTERHLHDMVSALDEAQPAIHRYLPVSDAVLQTAALMQKRPPNQRGFHELDLRRFVDDWDLMAHGLQRATSLLESANIFDAERIPTVVPIAVAAALLSGAEQDGDRRAVVDRLVRRYLWCSFFTNRYESSAATRAIGDYRALLDVVRGHGAEGEVPAFDRAQHPLPTLHDLLGVRWPKSKGTLPRAVLAASNYFGARDFADDTPVTASNITNREYHHLFPDSLLKEANIESYLALNCALITWKSNRVIGRLDPMRYLAARATNAPHDHSDVQQRLESHLVPYSELAAAGPYVGLDAEELRTAVKPDFNRFLHARAEWVRRLVVELCEGRQPRLSDIAGATGCPIDAVKVEETRSGAVSA